MKYRIVSHVLILMLGVAVGVLIAPHRTAPAAVAVALEPQFRAPSVIVAKAGLPDSERLRLDIRSILREELHAFATQRQDSRSAPVQENAPTRENEEAHSRAMTVVQAALTKRTWATEDSVALHRLLPQLTADQRAEVFHTLIPSLNAGEIRMEPDARLF
jgi:hypothetical protein